MHFVSLNNIYLFQEIILTYGTWFISLKFSDKSIMWMRDQDK